MTRGWITRAELDELRELERRRERRRNIRVGVIVLVTVLAWVLLFAHSCGGAP